MKAILFDLDGTLLDSNFDTLIEAYFQGYIGLVCPVAAAGSICEASRGFYICDADR